MHGNNLKIRRDNFRVCIDVLKSLKSQNGLNAYEIHTKANTNFQLLKEYLSFLEGEHYVGSRKPERNEKSHGPVRKVYFLEQRGHKFINEWEKYNARFDLDNLEKQLQSEFAKTL